MNIENEQKNHPSKAKHWKLNVQGVMISSDQSTILVSEALKEAGFNPDNGWILILKVKGEPKQSIELTDEIDLSLPGIEKLRLTPKEIVNGDVTTLSHMDFEILEKDRLYLSKLGICWAAVIDEERRWLIIHDYALVDGFNHEHVNIAIEIPLNYPDAAIDMFYVFPALTLTNGGAIAKTESVVSICNKPYQRWSRHLNGMTRWNPLTDSVITHMAIVDESLLREVGE